MEQIILHCITPDEFWAKMRAIIKEEMMQDQLLTREGALKMAGIGDARLKKAINEGTVKPQLIKGRKRAMYLESEVLKIRKYKRTDAQY